jgi:hypothetical protein
MHTILVLYIKYLHNENVLCMRLLSIFVGGVVQPNRKNLESYPQKTSRIVNIIYIRTTTVDCRCIVLQRRISKGGECVIVSYRIDYK